MSDGDSSASSGGDDGDASNPADGKNGGTGGSSGASNRSSGESSGSSGGSNGGSGASDGGSDSSEGESDPAKRTPETVEKALMVVGGVLTFLVLGYLVWYAVTVEPSGPPRATVVGTEELSDGRVAVHVVLHVPEGSGLVSATVSSECTSPPATTSFSNLPADTTWSGTLLCPAGTTDPTVSVSSWVEA